jgi:hypothetical protein
MADNSPKQQPTTNQTTSNIKPPQRPSMVYVQDSVDMNELIKRGIIINENKK